MSEFIERIVEDEGNKGNVTDFYGDLLYTYYEEPYCMMEHRNFLSDDGERVYVFGVKYVPEIYMDNRSHTYIMSTSDIDRMRKGGGPKDFGDTLGVPVGGVSWSDPNNLFRLCGYGNPEDAERLIDYFEDMANHAGM